MTSWRAGDRVILRGERWTILERASYADCETIRLAGVGAGSGTVRARTFVLPFDRPRRRGTVTSLRAVRPRRVLDHLRQVGSRVHPCGGLSTAAGSAIDLLPYQLAPALAMLRHGWARVLIADEPGLGKTIQAGLIAAEMRARSASTRVLILVPAGLRAQWAAEMSRHYGLSVVLADAGWLRTIAWELPAGTNPWTLPEVYLSSQDFVKRPEVLRPLEDVYWDLLIVDEAHGVTSGTDRRAAIDALACRARRVVLLTATPHDSDPAELAALIRIGGGASGGPLIAFRRSRRQTSKAVERRSRLLAVHLTEAERRMHALLDRYTRRVWREASARHDRNAQLVSIILRKRALSSAASLAVSLRRRLELLTDPRAAGGPEMPMQMGLPLEDGERIDDGEPVAALSAPGLADSRREVRWLTAILDTARAASRHEAKLRRLLALLRRIREPAIVFTEYRDTLARLREALASYGLDAVALHGGLSAADRADAQRVFNSRARLLLATDAASEGLNLHSRCRIVIHYELPWNPARLEQRAGRVDRIGQDRRVHEIGLVAADTAERLVLEPIARRVQQARRSGAGGGLLRLLTESRLAAAVMGAAPVRVAADDIPDALAERAVELHMPGLSDEADVEAARLSFQRGLISSSSRTGVDDDRPLVTALRSRSARWSAVFVHEVSIRAAEDESVLHAEMFVAGVEVAFTRLPRSAHALRLLAEGTYTDLRGPIEALLRGRMEMVRANVRDWQSGAAGRQAARTRDLTGTAGSAARRLVQGALFGRRADRDRGIEDCSIPPAPESAAATSLHARLVALILRPGRAR